MIHYCIGDATCPDIPGPKLIVHVCNNMGAWGKGFVLALSRRWRLPEECFRKWSSVGVYNNILYTLGNSQLIQVESTIYVLNMIAQDGLYTRKGIIPLRYSYLQRCLETAAVHAKQMHATVHMPRIGCGLAGGKWSIVEELIEYCLSGISVYVWDLK